ncbi:MAG: 4-hydroxyphenylacetate 3-hydroxylase family protein [Stellaceae bacterium]
MSVARTGADHLRSLNDGRAVYIDGEKVQDVTVHPAFRNAVRSAAYLYDFQAQPENIELMTFAPDGGGARISRCWEKPRSYDELVRRRRALEAWSETNYGFMGRSPDHVASTLLGQVLGIEVFRRHGEARARALLDYFDYVSRNDLFLTYVIVNPQGDRAKAWGEQDEFLVAQAVDEDSAGITVRGAKMLGTSAIMANEVLVANVQPLGPGEEKLALSFALPLNAKGLKLLSRKSYEAAAGARFDSPLSWQFDENDALLYFDDVKVPWERVFVHGDTDMCRAQFHDTPSHVFQNYQSQIRLSVKTRFLAGLALKLAETIGTIAFPVVRDQLGRIAAQAAMVESMMIGMEAGGHTGEGYFAPNRHFMYTAQVVTQELYPALVAAIRELAGGALIMQPSSVADWADAELAAIIRRTQRSPAVPPEDRVKFLKLAWDAVGSEFGSRHLQYEMFYAGAAFVTRGHSFRTYDWGRATGLVDRLMSGYGIAG